MEEKRLYNLLKELEFFLNQSYSDMTDLKNSIESVLEVL